MNTKLGNKWVDMQGNPYYRLSDEHGDMFLDVLCNSPNWYEIVPDFCRSHVLSYLVRLGRKTPEVSNDYRKINVYMYTLLRKVMDTVLVLSPSGDCVDESATLARCKAIVAKQGVRSFGSNLPFITGSPCKLTNINHEHTAAFISTLLGGGNVFVWLAAYLTWLNRLHIDYHTDVELSNFRDTFLKCTEIVELPYILNKGMGISMGAHDMLNLSACWYHKRCSAGPHTTLTAIQNMKLSKLMQTPYMPPEHMVYDLGNFMIVDDVYLAHEASQTPVVSYKIVDGMTDKEYQVDMWLRHVECKEKSHNLFDFIDKLGRVVDSQLFFYKMKYYTA